MPKGFFSTSCLYVQENWLRCTYLTGLKQGIALKMYVSYVLMMNRNCRSYAVLPVRITKQCLDSTEICCIMYKLR